MSPYSLVPLGTGVAAGLWAGRLNRPPAAALICLAPAVAVMFLAVRVQLDLRRKPETTIRERLLAEAPLGSGPSEVGVLIDHVDWRGLPYDEQQGFFHQGVRPARVVGSKHIHADAGHYYELFRADVHVYWGFDENERLIDVWVWRTINGL